MITVIHGGQTGVDRGAHEGAYDNGWRIAGYMPRNGRDELGQIPQDVRRFLVPHDKPGLGARTEANVRTVAATLIVVRDSHDPRATPGTAKTLDLAALRHLPRLIVDPTIDPTRVARWIWNGLLALGTLPLPLETPLGDQHDAPPPRILITGPRESKWQGARSETAALLRRIDRALTEISQTPNPARPPDGRLKD